MLKTAVVAASATYAFTVYIATRFTSSQRLGAMHFYGKTIPLKLKSLLISESVPVPEIVNSGKRSNTTFDTRFIHIAIPAYRRDVTDQELLSRFTKTFFGGHVIRPERLVLQTVGRTLALFRERGSSLNGVDQIWSTRQMCNCHLLPKHTKIFGLFQVLDSCVQSQKDSATGKETYIEIGFGNDRSNFSGVHRFSISRLKPKTPGSNEYVVLQFSCQVTSKPEPNFVASALKNVSFLHRIYADLLFRESVGEVENWLQNPDDYFEVYYY